MRNDVRIKARAETTVPTAVADGREVDKLYDQYGRAVQVRKSSTGAELGVNLEFTLLASATRGAEVSSTAQANLYHKGMIIFVDVTTDANSAIISPTIVMTPSIGTAKTIWTVTTPIADVGQFAYVFYPSAEDVGSYTEQQEMVIPPDWKFTMTVNDADDIVYSVTGCYIV